MSTSSSPLSLPQHIAIIMDGNGRWAQQQKLSRLKGHSKGTEVAQTIIEEASKKGIPYLTLFAFSTENWSRPADEINFLFSLLGKYLSSKGQELIDQNICLKTIGDLSGLPANLQLRIEDLKSKSQNNTGLKLIFALNYGGRSEIANAALSFAQDFAQDPKVQEKVKSQGFSAQDFKPYLESHFVPDPDLVIRTSGELRLSNFLLWQMAYSELYFSSKYWPDFTTKDFNKALSEYSLRQRRFGSLDPISTQPRTGSGALKSKKQPNKTDSAEEAFKPSNFETTS